MPVPSNYYIKKLAVKKKKKKKKEFFCGAASWGSSIVTAVAWVAAVAWVWSLTLELPHTMGAAKKEKKS